MKKEIILIDQRLLRPKDIVQLCRDGYSTVLKNGLFCAWKNVEPKFTSNILQVLGRGKGNSLNTSYLIPSPSTYSGRSPSEGEPNNTYNLNSWQDRKRTPDSSILEHSKAGHPRVGFKKSNQDIRGYQTAGRQEPKHPSESKDNVNPNLKFGFLSVSSLYHQMLKDIDIGLV